MQLKASRQNSAHQVLREFLDLHLKKGRLDIILLSKAHDHAHEGNRASPLPSLMFFVILPFSLGSQNDCLDPLHLGLRNKIS
jgi:hypothetical protein